MVKRLNYPLMKVPWIKRDGQVELSGWHHGDLHFLMNNKSGLILTGEADELIHLATAVERNDTSAINKAVDLKTAELLTWYMEPNLALWVPQKPKGVVLNVTHDCNLRCRYCFVKNEYEPDKTIMTLETAKKAVLSFKPEDISFFGGEPLLGWGMIRDLVPFAKANGCKHFHITTNGTLLTEQMAEFFKEHNFSFIVSIDGPPDVHDQARPYAGNEQMSSHAAAIEALAKLKAWEVTRITLRSTFDQHGPIKLVERLDYLNGLVRDGYARHVSVEPSYLSESCGCADKIDAGWMGDQEAEYAAAFDWCFEQVEVHKRKPTWHHIEAFLRRIWHGELHLSECGAGKGILAISPKGGVYACHRESETQIGHLDHGIDELKRLDWLDNRRAQRTPCISCPIRYICGGGCRQNSLNATGDIHRPCLQECKLKWILFRQCATLLARASFAQTVAILLGEGDHSNETPLRIGSVDDGRRRLLHDGMGEGRVTES